MPITSRRGVWVIVVLFHQPLLLPGASNFAKAESTSQRAGGNGPMTPWYELTLSCAA
jgi:hypothetical protein